MWGAIIGSLKNTKGDSSLSRLFHSQFRTPHFAIEIVSQTGFANYCSPSIFIYGYTTQKLSVSELDRARKVLLSHKYQVETREVLRLDLDNRPGSFAVVASRLGAAGINIEYCYATVGKGQKTAAVIVDVADLDRAMSMLEGVEG